MPELSTAATLTPDQATLVGYLKAGRTLTTAVAISHLGIASLSSRIAELRAKGYDISGERKRDFFGKPYVKYRLANVDQAPEE